MGRTVHRGIQKDARRQHIQSDIALAPLVWLVRGHDGGVRFIDAFDLKHFEDLDIAVMSRAGLLNSCRSLRSCHRFVCHFVATEVVGQS